MSTINLMNTVLLVEDNPDDEELALRALKNLDPSIEVSVVRDGEEALNYLLGAFENPYTRRKLPKVVLLDLKLPKLNGLDVLQRIRSTNRTRYLPVVVLTSSSEESDIRKCIDMGANSYVRKSIEYNQLIREIRQIAVYWALINQTPMVLE